VCVSRHTSCSDKYGAAVTFWELERVDSVAVATFRRPPRNLMSMAAMTELEALVDRIAIDDEIRILVLTGGLPGYFVAHARPRRPGRARAGPAGRG
jgi:enoyl-CoA hydratase/carnithine racemase